MVCFACTLLFIPMCSFSFSFICLASFEPAGESLEKKSMPIRESLGFSILEPNISPQICRLNGLLMGDGDGQVDGRLPCMLELIDKFIDEDGSWFDILIRGLTNHSNINLQYKALIQTRDKLCSR